MKYLFILFSIFTLNAQTLAFPEAQGFGRFATGGRGGTVLKVTNLNNSGTGSLREALLDTRSRIIVFTVGGRISLQTDIVVTSNNFTIIGHSAPSNSSGITVSNASIIINADNWIIQNVRFRLGDNGYKNSSGQIVGTDSTDRDTFRVGDADNWIIDTCEFMWGIDENFSINPTGGATTNGTLQRSIVAEGLLNSHHSEGSHSMGTLVFLGAENISFYQNLYAHNSERNIRFREDISFEMINNIFYDFAYGTVATNGSQFRAVNNHYKEGNTTIAPSSRYLFSATSGGTDMQSAYIQGNTWDLITVYNPPIAETNITTVSTATVASNIVPLSVTNSINDVVEKVGVRLPFFDSQSQRIVNDFINRTGNLIDTQEQVGGFGNTISGTPWTDTDNDGMNDDLEIMLFGNLLLTANGDLDSDGFTNIEELYFIKENIKYSNQIFNKEILKRVYH